MRARCNCEYVVEGDLAALERIAVPPPAVGLSAGLLSRALGDAFASCYIADVITVDGCTGSPALAAGWRGRVQGSDKGASVLGSKPHYPLRLLKMDLNAAADDGGDSPAHHAIAALGPFVGRAAAATQRLAPHILTRHHATIGALEPSMAGRLAYPPRHTQGCAGPDAPFLAYPKCYLRHKGPPLCLPPEGSAELAALSQEERDAAASFSREDEVCGLIACHSDPSDFDVGVCHYIPVEREPAGADMVEGGAGERKGRKGKKKKGER